MIFFLKRQTYILYSQLFVCQIWGVLVQKLSSPKLQKFCHLATTACSKQSKLCKTPQENTKMPQIWQTNSKLLCLPIKKIAPNVVVFKPQIVGIYLPYSYFFSQIASMITIAPAKKVGEAKIVLSNWLVVEKWYAWIMELVPLGWWEKLITELIVPANLDILTPGVKVRLPFLWRVIPTSKCLPMEETEAKDMNSPWGLGPHWETVW